ncbi:MAG: type II secretion system F family protein [Thermoplasmatota archaeon]
MADYAHRLYHLGPNIGARFARYHPRLDSQLQRARILMRKEVYAAMAIWTTLFALLAALLVVGLFALGDQQGYLELSSQTIIILAAGGLLTTILTYASFYIRLPLRVQSRQRDIDAKLPYAINYLAAMSGSGGTPTAMLRGLARQEVYGEVQKEIAWVLRDVEVLGIDLLTALAKAQDRAPSTKLQDFLQGISTNLSTGGDLDTYFQAKSEQYMTENRQRQEGFIESLGVLAESFVTVVVAAPLFIVVLMSVMTTFSSGGSLLIGFVLTLLIVPLSQAAFVVAINTLTPEA